MGKGARPNLNKPDEKEGKAKDEIQEQLDAGSVKSTTDSPASTGVDAVPPQTGAGSNYAKQRAMREGINARLFAIEIKKKMGVLIEVDKVKVIFFNHTHRVQEALLNIPERLAAILASEGREKKIHKILRKEIKSALLNLSDGKFNIK